MRKPFLRKRKYLTLAVVCIVVLIAGLVACTPGAGTGTSSSGSGTTTPVSVEQPTPDSFGVVHADQWKEAYPNQVATYEANSSNSPASGKHNYLELYPALSTLYAGMPFSKGYDEASSHVYSLDSVRGTPRVGDATLLNCYTCKTPQLTASVNNNGDAEYAKPFAEGASLFDEPISCYNCHENDPETITLGSQFFVKALGSDSSKVPEQAQVCGQCHNEYYFNGETKVPTLPYTGLAAMSPEKILAYYDEMGYKDWAYPGTDTPMIKVQHPEFETVYGGGTQGNMATLGYSCADCHMGTATADDGTEYTSHEWKSPLENQALIDSTCSTCHSDLEGQVKDWQEASEARVQSISLKIADLATKMVAQVADGSLTGDRLAQLQKLHRTSQFYWDFVMVENSEGAHNPDRQNEILDLAEAAVDEGLALLG